MQPAGQPTVESIAFYLAVFVIASLATFARSVAQDSGLNWRYIVAKSFSAGFIAFGAISFIVGGDADHVHTHWYFLGLAALIGLLAREQDKIARLLLAKALRIGKILSEEEKDGEHKS